MMFSLKCDKIFSSVRVCTNKTTEVSKKFDSQRLNKQWFDNSNDENEPLKDAPRETLSVAVNRKKLKPAIETNHKSSCRTFTMKFNLNEEIII